MNKQKPSERLAHPGWTFSEILIIKELVIILDEFQEKIEKLEEDNRLLRDQLSIVKIVKDEHLLS